MAVTPHGLRGRLTSANLSAAGVLALALLGAASALYATGLGAGIGADGVTYIESARNLLTGHGLTTILAADGQPQALTHFPPLYPLLLALAGLSVGDPLVSARFVNAFVFGVNIFLVGQIIREYTGGAVLPSVLGSLLVFSSVDMLKAHTMVWSEPLFILLSLLSLWLLAKYLDTPSSKLLVGAGLTMSLAWLARYAAPPLIITGLITLVAVGRGPFCSRLTAATVLLLVSCTPMGLWMARNVTLSGSPANRALVYHPVSLNHLDNGWHTILTWLSPLFTATLWHKKRALALLGISTCAAIFTAYWPRANRAIPMRPSHPAALATLPSLVGIYIISYVSFLLLSISFFDYHTPLDARLLLPVFVFTVILTLTQAHRWLSGTFVRPATKAIPLLFSILFAGAYLDQATAWLGLTADFGQEYTTSAWTQSATMRELKQSYQDKVVYSNAPDVIYLATGRHAEMIPEKVNPNTGTPEARYLAAVHTMRQRMQADKAILVYFSTDLVSWRYYLPSEVELTSILPLTVLSRQSDGRIYGIATQSTKGVSE